MPRNKIIGLTLIIISISIPIINYINILHKETDKEVKVAKYIELTKLSTTTFEEKKEITNNDYIAILEIPEIFLKRGLLPIDNKYNNIDYNIAIMEPSMFPDNPNSNLILASHNGTSNVSFFKDLEKINIGSKVYIYYQGYKYIYEISNNYTVKKTGKVNVIRDIAKTTITLITCKNNTDDEQIVYIGYLIDKETY